MVGTIGGSTFRQQLGVPCFHIREGARFRTSLG